MKPSISPLLEVSELRKHYGGVPAVNGLSFSVQAGELYALVGPNGAGKTTTLNMLAGLLHPDAGTITIAGVPLRQQPRKAKMQIAYVPDEPALYSRLTPLEYLVFVGRLWDMRPAEAHAQALHLLDLLGLADKRGEYCEGLSRGMRQKVALAGGLIHDPDLLILDEPMTALDSIAVRQMKDLILERTRHGKAVLLTTHLLDVAERLADRIGVIRAGRIVAEGSLDELKRTHGTHASLEEIFLQTVAEESPC